MVELTKNEMLLINGGDAFTKSLGYGLGVIAGHLRKWLQASGDHLAECAVVI